MSSKNTSQHKVSVIIRALNEEEYLDETLNRIKKQCHSPVEIIVLDSGSTDKTVEIAEKNGAKIVLYSRKSWSWGGALNDAIDHASGEYLFICSAHCLLKYSDAFTYSVQLMEDEKCHAVYGHQFSIPKMNIIEELTYKKIYNFEHKVYDSQKVLSGECPIITNSACFVRRLDCLKQPFNEDISSLEDYYWIRQTIGNKTISCHQRLGVFHSHELDASTIYRREYARELEARKIRSSNTKFSRLKSTIIGLIWLYRTIVVLPWSINNIKIALLIALANMTAYHDWSKGLERKYWEIKIPNIRITPTRISDLSGLPFL